jgi:hypothetical protein
MRFCGLTSSRLYLLFQAYTSPLAKQPWQTRGDDLPRSTGRKSPDDLVTPLRTSSDLVGWLISGIIIT